MKKDYKREVLTLLFFIPMFLTADTITYTDGIVLDGKIISQNTYSLLLKTNEGTIYKIIKSSVSKIKYGDSEKKYQDNKVSSIPLKTEIINLPTNTKENIQFNNNSKSSNRALSSNEPELVSNLYYQILKDSKVYLIRLQGNNFKEIDRVILENAGQSNEQEIYNLQAKSVEFMVKSSELDLGFYDLVIQSKTGAKVRREYFVEVKEP